MKNQVKDTWSPLRVRLAEHLADAERGAQARFAREVGIDRRTVPALLKGASEPRYSLGLAISKWLDRKKRA